MWRKLLMLADRNFASSYACAKCRRTGPVGLQLLLLLLLVVLLVFVIGQIEQQAEYAL